MSALFHSYIYQPILYILIFLYENVALHDLGIAIFELTILVRIVLFPIFYKGAKDQTILQKLQPRIKEIQNTHKENKEEQTRALLALYREHKFNPFSSFFLLLLQLPVFIALFQIFTRELSTSAFDSHTLLGLINLGEKSIPMAIIAAGLQYFQAKLSLPKQVPQESNQGFKNPMASFGKTMTIVGPGLTFVILLNLPAALGFYWAVSTVFSLIQQVYINRRINKQ